MASRDNLTVDTSFTQTSSRRPYNHSSMPSSPSRSLREPSLVSDDSTSSPVDPAILTPEARILGRLEQDEPNSKHSMLSALAEAPSPVFPVGFDGQHLGHPLKLPHQAMKRSLTDFSPPHTPKGHPMEGKSMFNFDRRIFPVSNPYAGGKASYTQTLAHLLRVPRRFRPILLIGFCLFIFGTVYVNHAVRDVESVSFLAKKRDVYPDVSSYNHKNDLPSRHQQAVLAQEDEAMVQSNVWQQGTPVPFDDPTEELVALISYLTRATSNVLLDADPSVPLDMGNIVDFDPTRSDARENLEFLMDETNEILPIVLFGRMRDPWHREVQKMLAEYRITPAPLIIDVDQRRDQSVIVPLLARIFGTDELPQLVIKGQVIGSYHEMLDAHDGGKLVKTLEEIGGVSVQSIRKRVKGVKERERVENERLLGPAPIVEQQ